MGLPRRGGPVHHHWESDLKRYKEIRNLSVMKQEIDDGKVGWDSVVDQIRWMENRVREMKLMLWKVRWSRMSETFGRNDG